jgi:hypothetical protein
MLITEYCHLFTTNCKLNLVSLVCCSFVIDIFCYPDQYLFLIKVINHV